MGFPFLQWALRHSRVCISDENVGGILTFGVGLETSLGTCMAGIYLCVFFYATSKLLVYCFLSKSQASFLVFDTDWSI